MKITDQTVIVPWDFSEMSLSALKKTLEMVDGPEQLEVIHVIPYPSPSVTEHGVIWGSLMDTAYLDDVKKSFHEKIESEGLPGLVFTTEFGDPGSRIVELAQKKEAGLIVISSHGYTGISRLLLGSVAERVVRMATCPVLVLRGLESNADHSDED